MDSFPPPLRIPRAWREADLDVVGVTRVRNCCSFVWMQDEQRPRRLVLARPYHCAACIGEMVRSAKLQRITVAGAIPMDRVREVLARRREELLDRWTRQLRATAEAGFALDPRTAEVLPRLLDAADRALERRFRGLAAGMTSSAAEGQRAAIHCSLLRDFLLDAVLDLLPQSTAAEHRLLGDALAHAGVEVLVQDALEREDERRRREGARLARLAHELRNSATAARLALDLLRRRGALPDSRTARLLDSSLSALGNGIEDTLFDEALCAGELRLSAVPLAPMLEAARSAAPELGGREKNISVMLTRSGEALRVRADPRLVRPAVRGLLRAALEIARRGATIRLGADRAGDSARVAVSVDGCRRLPGNRLPQLTALSLARRAARAHGGALSARLPAPGRCELRLSLPGIQTD